MLYTNIANSLPFQSPQPCDQFNGILFLWLKKTKLNDPVATFYFVFLKVVVLTNKL